MSWKELSQTCSKKTTFCHSQSKWHADKTCKKTANKDCMPEHLAKKKEKKGVIGIRSCFA